MIPPAAMRPTADPGRALLRLYRTLPAEQQRTLLAFAEFLAQQSRPETREVPPPKEIPRPDEESVVKAMKRLSASYHMLDKARLLDETSALMAQHLIQGRPAREVIDELEVVFQLHYRRLTGEGE